MALADSRAQQQLLLILDKKLTVAEEKPDPGIQTRYHQIVKRNHLTTSLFDYSIIKLNKNLTFITYLIKEIKKMEIINPLNY